MSAGLIKAEGHEPVTTVDDGHCDAPVMVLWSDDWRGYGYFSETTGWVSVAEEKVVTFVVDVAAVVRMLARKLGLAANPMTTLVPDRMWDLGSAYLGHRTKRTPILFGRRLSDPTIRRQIETALRNRPAPQRRVLLTSTGSMQLPRSPRNCELVSITDVLEDQDSFAIDPDVLGLRLDGQPAIDAEGPLLVIAEGREVRFYGQVYRFSKGDKQRQVIVLLYERYLEGQRAVSSAELAEQLEFGPNTRVRDLFKKHDAWGRLLTEKHGMCGFCFPDNE